MSNHPVGLLRLLLAGLLTMTLQMASTQAASRFELPPLVAPANHEHHEGKIVWADLVTPDTETAKTFYGGLFGWTFRDLQAEPKDYTLALLNGVPVAGLVRRSEPLGEGRHPAWLTFLAVKDVEKAMHVALAHGAKQLTPPRNYPRRGRQIVLADPQGAVFAVLQSASGDPPDVLANPGEWIWSALLTADPDTDAAFYQTLFDSEVFDSAADDQGSQHLVLSTDGYARGTCNSFPQNATKRDPHWLAYVRVADIADTVARARQLGGRVLVEPRPEPGGGSSAVVADPAGAAIGLLEWSDSDGEGESGAGASK